MSIQTMPGGHVGAPPPLPMRRFSVDEYHRMIGGGFFADDERFELLEGWIVFKMTRNPPHDATIGLVSDALGAVLPGGWLVRVQSAITTGESEPEPDLALVRGANRDYVARHPGPAEVALAVEVADSSLAIDRELKGRIYARAGIPAYWVVNLVEHRVEVYSAPTGPDPNPGYRERRDFEPGEMIPLVIEGREVARIDARAILP